MKTISQTGKACSIAHVNILLSGILTVLLTSCGYPLMGKGYIKMVEPSCKPIINKRIHVNNIESAVFLNSGHLTRDSYYTNEYGVFGFDIEKSSDRLIVYLQDEKGGKDGETRWNWWTATSNNDEILLSSGPGDIAEFKSELLKSSTEKPIIIVHPYTKNRCNNDNHELDKYYIPKINADKKAKKAAEEKARIDAIKVVIPIYKTKAYGVMEMYSVPGDAGYKIKEISNYIKKEQQKLYTMFGIFVEASEPAVLKYSTDITYTIIYPEPGLTDPSTGITTKSRSLGYWEKHAGDTDSMKKELIMAMVFKEQWQIKPGEWVFQIKHKDSILLEQSFIVE